MYGLNERDKNSARAFQHFITFRDDIFEMKYLSLLVFQIYVLLVFHDQGDKSKLKLCFAMW